MILKVVYCVLKFIKILKIVTFFKIFFSNLIIFDEFEIFKYFSIFFAVDDKKMTKKILKMTRDFKFKNNFVPWVV